MTDDDKILLNKLRDNAESLFQAFQEKNNEVKALYEKLEVIQTKLDELSKEKAHLEQKNENLMLANRILSGNDESQEARQKIHKIVREIDKCIALLNG